MTIELKTFQKNTLAVLAKYLEQARLTDDPQQAFLAVARDPHGRVPLYRRVPGLEACPTSACACPPAAARPSSRRTPSARRRAATSRRNTRSSSGSCPPTPSASRPRTRSKTTAHSYRQALDDAFEGRVAVFDIADIDNLRPADLSDRVCVIVGTIQTLRVEKTEGRDVYAHKEALESHFTRLNTARPDLERFGDGPNAGRSNTPSPTC